MSVPPGNISGNNLFLAPQTCSCNSGYTAPDCAASCTSVTCTGNQFCGQTNNCTFCKLPYQNPPICDQQCEQKKIVTANFSGNCNGQARCNERGSCIGNFFFMLRNGPPRIKKCFWGKNIGTNSH